MNQPAYYVPQMANIADRVNRPVRIVQCIQMHNEEEFAEAVLSSIYNEVDRILVIEGAVENRPNSTEDGHSTDRTREILSDFKANRDPDNKLVIISINKHWKDLEDMKQTFLDMSIPGDWILINDADEFYRPEDIRRLRRAIELEPQAQEFIPTFLHFYRDLDHIAVPGPEWNTQHQRIFKYVRGMKYNSHPVLTDPAGHCTYFSPHYQPRRIVPRDPIFIYHYGYARRNMNEVMEQKQEYYKGELAKHDNADVKFDQKVKDWVDVTEPVLYFDGEHPAVINHRPQVAQHCDCDNNWKDNSFYKKALAGEDVGNIWLCMTNQAQPHMQHYHNGMSF